MDWPTAKNSSAKKTLCSGLLLRLTSTYSSTNQVFSFSSKGLNFKSADALLKEEPLENAALCATREANQTMCLPKIEKRAPLLEHGGGAECQTARRLRDSALFREREDSRSEDLFFKGGCLFFSRALRRFLPIN